MDMPPSSEVPTQPAIHDLMAHADTLYRYAMARVNNHHLAEDLVQEALFTAWKRAGEFEGRSTPATWLIGILKFKILDQFRRSKRTPTELADPPAEDDHEGMDQLFDADGSWRVDPNAGLGFLEDGTRDGAWRGEVLEGVRACLAALPERLRLLFTLREIDDLPVSSAASAAGVTRGSAGVLLSRARRNLRTCLQQKEVEP